MHISTFLLGAGLAAALRRTSPPTDLTGSLGFVKRDVALDSEHEQVKTQEQQLAELQQLEELANADLRLISLGEGAGQQRWMLESDKEALRRAGIRFFDITDHCEIGSINAARVAPRCKSSVDAQSHVGGGGNKNKKKDKKHHADKDKKDKKKKKKHTQKEFPTTLKEHVDEVEGYLKNVTRGNLVTNLGIFSSFHTRYYKSSYGAASGKFLYHLVQNVSSTSVHNISVRQFEHPWGQHSVIASIPGYEDPETVVVVGAHQDSANLFLPQLLAAPGADDDGSGTVTILEALRVLLAAGHHWRPRNTIEFHWYSAEEGGLLGSLAVFADYERRGVDVAAMLQQDMTGYVPAKKIPPKMLSSTKPTADVHEHEHGHELVESGRVRDFLKKRSLHTDSAVDKKDDDLDRKGETVGVIVDYVDPKLTEFVKLCVETYCAVPWEETKCGYACSDHASASRAGYRSAFVFETAFERSNPHVHSTADTVDKLDFRHMEEHVRLTVGFAVELGYF